MSGADRQLSTSRRGFLLAGAAFVAAAAGAGALSQVTGQSTRNPLQQPFSVTSPWNMPIGTGAVYVSVAMPSYGPNGPTNYTPMPNIDDERIVLTPTAPATTIDYCSVGWSGGNRCTATGGSANGLPITVPMPASFTVPNDNQNECAAFLLADGRTIAQCQPLARGMAGTGGTALVAFANVDLYGDGIAGAHGGSGLSAIGGSIRIGELRPGQTGMRHALKIAVDCQSVLAPQTSYDNCYRWPATAADSYWTSYGSRNSDQYSGMKMGALLAIPASVSLSSLGLQSAPGLQLAWTLQNYGAYIVDTTNGGGGYVLCADGGANGSMRTQFQNDWGYGLFARIRDNTPWSIDYQECMVALQLVDNNSASSIGGGGTPLQPLAPPI